ncbi:hypothetical protein APHAL10511_006575 [Amanita phalloides]|nr:hypothetical protein APHAL10511_006575 [Amanita phalloides]
MFVTQVDPLPTTAYKYQHPESPLDTLVRRTSVRKENFQKSAPGTSKHVEKRAPRDSPLLHGRFARDSYATASSKESSYFSHDDESAYSDAVTDYTWHGSMFLQTAQVNAGLDVESSHCVNVDMSQSHSSVPALIVSSADADEAEHDMHGGRTPIVASGTPNFSRPGRPVIPPSDDEKWRVLERNMKRARDDGAAVKPPSPNGARHYRPSPLSRGGETWANPAATISRSSSRSPSPLSTTSPPTVQTTQPPNPGIFDSSRNLDLPMIPGAVSLPGTPPSRSFSPATSLYSSYSYYPFEDSISSSASNSRAPTPSQRLHPETPNVQPTPLVHSFPSQGSRTPQEYLQLGIQYHEANKLEDSAMYFEKSAKENGGCGVGMLMWGLALRHGWGCRKDEKSGFKWLQRAAEYAVEDLGSARIGGSLDPQAVRTELVLAIYEVGQCFFQGWGAPKDQKMAVSYYEVAARLGDSDAQNDLAFCLANGKGCKKNRKEAARWYRAAVAQGQSDVGLAWIYKEKYQ